jgi:YVTN family beta-propeller protein
MMQFRILGSLEVARDGRPVTLGGTRQRAVLAILLLHRQEVVSVDRLVDELWGERPPGTATKTVQVYVSRLRKELGEGVLLTRGGGYVLDIEPEQLDGARFERLAHEGMGALDRDEVSSARDLFGEALALWRGPALDDLAYEQFAQGEIARLEELRLATLEARIEADLALGRHSELVPELEILVREHPVRERLRAQLILALYRSGRQADALASYRDARRALVEELGLEPSRELKELEQRVLTQDPVLDAPARRAPAGAAPEDRRRGWALVLLGGGLLLAAVLAAMAVSGGDGADPRRAPENSVAVLDPGSNEVVATVPTGVRPADIAASAGDIWVANHADNTVTQIDPARRKVVGTVSPGLTVGGLAGGGDDLWIGDARRSRLVRLDPGFRSVASTIRFFSSAVDFAAPGTNPVAMGQGSVWVGRGYGTVARVDPVTGDVVHATVGNNPSAIAVGAGGVWVVDDADNTLTRIDPASASADTTTTPVGRAPSAVAAGTNAVWVANTQDDTVARVDPRTGSVIRTIHVGRRPTGIAVGAGAVWVANSLSGTVSRIDPTTNQVEATIEIGEAPQSVTVARGQVWVSVQDRGGAGSSGRAARGGVATLLVPKDPGPTDPPFDFDVQRQYATCAMLYNFPDLPFPQGARLEPEVALGPPSVSADGLTYEFSIRPGFRFSPPSGEPVTAKAFERAIERTLSHRLGSLGAELLADIAGARDYIDGRARRIAGLSTRDGRLVIRLEDRTPNLPARLASPFFCAVPPSTPIRPQGVDAIPSAGPYYVASHIPKRSLVLRRNPGYHGSRPRRLAEIRYRLGVPAEDAVGAVEAGRADYMVLRPIDSPGVPPREERRLASRYGPRSAAARAGHQQLFTQAVPNVYSFVFNTRRGPFRDVRLRRAVNYAMDRRALAEHTGLGEAGQPTDQFIAPGMPGFEDATIYPLGGPDIRTARRLAGGTRRHAVLYTCDRPGCTRHAAILQSNLEAMGIDLDVRQFTIGEMFERTRDPHEPFDISYNNWYFDVADPFSYINLQFSRIGFKPDLFYDPEMERRMVAANRLVGTARLRAYADLDRDLAERAVPAAVFASGTAGYFLSARMGCQLLHPIYGLDLASLCIRRGQRSSRSSDSELMQ